MTRTTTMKIIIIIKLIKKKKNNNNNNNNNNSNNNNNIIIISPLNCDEKVHHFQSQQLHCCIFIVTKVCKDSVVSGYS